MSCNTKEIEEDENCQCNVWGLGMVANLFSTHGKSSPCSDPITDDESSCNSENDDDDDDDTKVEQVLDNKPAEGYDEFLKFINPQGVEERQENDEDPTMAEIQSLVNESDIPQAKVDEMFIMFEGKEKKLLRHLRKLKKSRND